MGFTYDYYTTDDVVQETTQTKRPNVVLEAAVMDTLTAQKYADIISTYEYDSTKITDEHYYEVCEEKRKNSCYYFSENTNGFEAKINLDEDKLLFFSVPYEDGWTATVNGNPVDIDVVNYGFMAIRCPAGENDIQFSYKTAGLYEGRIISVAGLGLFAIYMAAGYVINRKKKFADAAESDRKNGEVTESIPSEEAFKAITESEEKNNDGDEE
jgi:uncharacterized membrane protein YfhO